MSDAAKTQRVLLIDDDQFFLQVFGDLLRGEGWDVVCERSATAALSRLIGNEKFHLAICDVRMAGMDGWAFLRHVRDVLRLDTLALPVIIVSAYDHVDTEFQAMSRANAWLTKPIEPPEKLVRQARLLMGIPTENRWVVT